MQIQLPDTQQMTDSSAEPTSRSQKPKILKKTTSIDSSKRHSIKEA